MAKTRKIPLRKSVVSNEIIDKRDLLRIVKNKEGQIFIDPTGKANGRGAYIKLDNEEALQAKQKRVFNRSFNMEVEDDFYDELIYSALSKTKKVKFSLIRQVRRTDVELISNLIMKKRFKLSKNESLIAVSIWKWKTIFTMN